VKARIIVAAKFDVAMKADFPGAIAVEHAVQKLIIIKDRPLNQTALGLSVY